MSGRWQKKLNLLIEFSDSIFIKFYLKHIGIQNKSVYSFFYFQLFVCPPDVKRPKFFRSFKPPEPLPGSCHEPLVELKVPSDLPPTIYNNRKLNFCSKTDLDIRENAWINACPQEGTCYGQMLNVRGQKEASFSESYSLKTKKKTKPI